MSPEVDEDVRGTRFQFRSPFGCYQLQNGEWQTVEDARASGLLEKELSSQPPSS